MRLQEAANTALCSIGKADLASAQAVIAAGAVRCIKGHLAGHNAGVQEAGLTTLTALAESNADLAADMLEEELAHKVVAVLHIKDAPPPLLEAAARALKAHAMHDATLAHRVLDAGAASALVSVLTNNAALQRPKRLQAAVLECLSFMAHHDTAGATAVVNAGAVRPAMEHVIDDGNAAVRRAAACLLQRFATRTPTLAENVASDGCIMGLLQALKLDHDTPHAVAPLTALGHIGAFGVQFAQAVRALSCCRLLGKRGAMA